MHFLLLNTVAPTLMRLAHFAKGKWSADEIPLQQLLGEAIVIDVLERLTTMLIT
jgi:kynurenine formamidase